MSGFVPALGWTLLHFLWQGLLIGCATALARAALRNARPEARYAVGCGALLACLAWPAAGLYLRLAGGDATGALFSSALLPAALLAPDSLPGLDLLLRAVVGVWALCAAVLALRMALGMLWIERSASQPAGRNVQWQARLSGMALEAGITRAIRLRVVDGIASPLAAGIWRPVVLVPASLVTGMPPDLLAALLAHELAHIRRHDYLVNLLQNAIEALLFFHPAVWWISRGVRLEREHIADDFAARQLGEPRRLALALSELERLQFSTHHLAVAANGGSYVTYQTIAAPRTTSIELEGGRAAAGTGRRLPRHLWPGGGGRHAHPGRWPTRARLQHLRQAGLARRRTASQADRYRHPVVPGQRGRQSRAIQRGAQQRPSGTR